MTGASLPKVPDFLQPEYSSWAIYPTWQLDEAAALSLGIDPSGAVRHHRNLQFRNEYRALKVELEERHKLIERFGRAGRIGHGSTPAEFVAFMRSAGIGFPPELQIAVDAVAEQIDWQRRAEELERRVQELEDKINDMGNAPPAPDLGERERTSLLKLAIGMAMKGYKYNPAAYRNPATQEIADDLANCGLELDVDTVRKYLQQARELVPPPETE